MRLSAPGSSGAVAASCCHSGKLASISARSFALMPSSCDATVVSPTRRRRAAGCDTGPRLLRRGQPEPAEDGAVEGDDLGDGAVDDAQNVERERRGGIVAGAAHVARDGRL